MLNGKSILITGGTGSLGKELTKTILTKWPNVKRLVIYSRDEQKQFQMAQEFPDTIYPAIRYFIGDVRDLERLKRAFIGIEYVIHAAALKQVDTGEYNPIELAWSKFKNHIKRIKPRYELFLKESIKNAIASISPENAEGYFRHVESFYVTVN